MERYFIDEKLARDAQRMFSMSDYVEGSATAEYIAEIEKVEKLVQEVRERQPDNVEKAEYLAERYSKKLAEWINKENAIESRCPSVLICGAGNFPTRRKEKQNAARDSHMEKHKEIENLVGRIESLVYRSAIYSDDKNALEKLEKRLADLQEKQEHMKKVNAFYRKNKSIDCDFITKEEKEDILKTMSCCAWVTQPYPSYALSNNNANIRRIKGRIEEQKKLLEQCKEPQSQTSETDIFEVVENADQMRLQLIFDGKPDEAIRTILKSNGFRWSPKNTAWQRQLTQNARYALNMVREEIKNL